MKTVDLYSECPKLRGLRGDSFPQFHITLTGASGVGDYEMRLVLENKYSPGSIALTKACTHISDASGERFTVRLTSTDTAELCGSYTMHFILNDGYGGEYRKLIGTLEVFDTPREVT